MKKQVKNLVAATDALESKKLELRDLKKQYADHTIEVSKIEKALLIAQITKDKLAKAK